MFKPKYTLSSKLLNNIATSERLYGQIEALKLPQKLELNLKRDNLIQSTYASNKIEGNPMTLPEVTNLLLDDRIPVNRDEKEVVNYFSLLEQMDDYKETPLSNELVAKLHKKVFEGVHESAGEIRDEAVAIGRYTGETGNISFKIKHNPPFHAKAEIAHALDELVKWSKEEQDLPIILKTGIFHHQFVYIHPFEDGNGRVCRILTALLFVQANYHINKYFVLDDYYDIDRNLYSDKLHTADEGDKTEWLEYYSDGVKYSLQSALSKSETAMRTLSMAERPTPKEKEVLEMMLQQPEMTSSEVAEKLEVSRQQAHNLLSALVDKGMIERKGSTKSSYYVLK
jgi:Fic family protein